MRNADLKLFIETHRFVESDNIFHIFGSCVSLMLAKIIKKLKNTIPWICLSKYQNDLEINIYTSSCIFTKTFRPDGIPVVVLKNCEPELICILADLFNMCLNEFVFKNSRGGLWLKTATLLVFFLRLVKYSKNLYIVGF